MALIRCRCVNIRETKHFSSSRIERGGLPRIPALADQARRLEQVAVLLQDAAFSIPDCPAKISVPSA